jgi:hypothetical protein
MMVSAARRGRIEPEARPELIETIRRVSTPFRSARNLDPLIERIGYARFVLLGEASHGIAEYYEWRAEISRRLIAERGFRFIAVEGDWPCCGRLDQYIKGRGDRDVREPLQAFGRLPTWMWANDEVAEFNIETRWLPTACPELKPVEDLGRWLKGKVLQNHQPEDFADTVSTAAEAINGLTNRDIWRVAGLMSGNFWLPT